jgi:hypothetical protein
MFRHPCVFLEGTPIFKDVLQVLSFKDQALRVSSGLEGLAVEHEPFQLIFDLRKWLHHTRWSCTA